MKKTAGYFLFGVAALVVLLVVGTAVRDVIWATRMQPSSPGEAGFQTGSFIGIVIRSLILGGVALGLFHWGRALVNPAKYSRTKLEQDRLHRIYVQEKLDQRAFSSVNDDLDYVNKSAADLDSIYHAISREKAPARFEALLAAIKKKVEQEPQQPHAEATSETAPSAVSEASDA
ncbi:MAG: hypothetical protein GVY36_19315 [Verrucomicrobia bacterium]|jgi:hypothetical protein|nr:hypothetical protein [Verrucomicrobiota bacterium]